MVAGTKRATKEVYIAQVQEKSSMKSEAYSQCSPDDRPWSVCPRQGSSTYQQIPEEANSNTIHHTPLTHHQNWKRKIQTNLQKVTTTASGWRSPGDILQERVTIIEEKGETPPYHELFVEVEHWLTKLKSEKKTTRTGFHREVKKWIGLLRDKVSEE